MANISVFKQLTSGTSECLEVLRKEIGMKSTCSPFAVKLITAAKDLYVPTEQDALHAVNVMLSGLQTLMQGGIVPEDYDKIDFVKRGKTLVPSARVEAFLRAAARKGYRITDTIVAVPKEDAGTTYFKENFYNGDIVYTLEDARTNPDRAVTADRLLSGYFEKFICRLEVRTAKDNKRVAVSVCELPLADLMMIAAASEQGFYKTNWIEVKTPNGTRKKKVVTDELNTDTFWVKWTSEMVNKTVIRRALKRIREVLPELTDTIYAFDQDADMVPEEETTPTVPVVEPPVIETDSVNLKKLTPQQQEDCLEMLSLFKANPKLAEDKLLLIKTQLEEGYAVQDVIDKEYASIVCLQKSPKKWAEIGAWFS